MTQTYDIMEYEGALYVPPSGDLPLFSVSVLLECVVELCVLCLSLCTLYHSVYSSRTMGSVLLYCI